MPQPLKPGLRASGLVRAFGPKVTPRNFSTEKFFVAQVMKVTFMTRIITFIKTKPQALLIGFLSIASIITFASAQTLSDIPSDKTDIQSTEGVVSDLSTKPTQQPESTPEPTENVQGSSDSDVNISPIRTADTNAAKPSSGLTNSLESQQPTATKTPTPTLTPTPVIETVAVTLMQPNGTQNFTVAWQNSMNACDVLKQAKAEGDIASLTLDASYVATFGSPYVYEINGYKDSWVFLINGISSSKGCTSVTIQKDDHVTWKFV